MNVLISFQILEYNLSKSTSDFKEGPNKPQFQK